MPPLKTRSLRKRKLKDEEEEEEGVSASTKRSKTEVTSKRAKSQKSSSKSSSKSTESAEALKSAEASKSVAPSNSAGSESGQRAFSHWLFKSEPESRFERGIDVKFGFDDLKAEPDQTACWDGVRNYQARNFMKDHMRVGDRAFFYHR